MKSDQSKQTIEKPTELEVIITRYHNQLGRIRRIKDADAVLQAHKDATDEVMQALLSLFDAEMEKRVKETEKAYGGCHNCYGKGYSTGAAIWTAKGKKWGDTNQMKFCSCDRGKQLEAHTQSKLKAFAGEVEEAIGEDNKSRTSVNYLRRELRESLKAIKEKYQL